MNVPSFIDRAHLVDSLSWSHGSFDVQGLDVLPVLLQQGNQKVDGQGNISIQLLFGHVYMSDTSCQTQHLQVEISVVVCD